MARKSDLEAQLLADPGNVDLHLVYADFLQSNGDPRGELITLQHAGKDAEANAYIDAHADALLGPLKHYRTTFEGSQSDAFEWRLGFIRSARLGYDCNVVADADIEEGVVISLETGLAELLQHPSGMLLEELVVTINMCDDGAYFEPIVQTLAKYGAPLLKRLRLGEFSCAGGPGGQGDYEYEISWTTIGDASALWKAVPRLERLVLQVGLGSTSSSGTTDHLGSIDLPNLRHLEVITGGMSTSCLASFAGASWPSLTYMDLWLGSSSYGFAATVEAIAPILDGGGLPKLEHLGLVNCELTDEICERLGSATILARLDEVSLAYGTMSDAGASALAGTKSAFRHLKRLDLSGNCLTPAGIAAVTDLCAQVLTQEQKDDEERYVSLSE